jgi:O-antigen/teichoic acid export membrane protein
MRGLRKLPNGRYNALAGNVTARLGALGCLFVATVLLARSGSAAVVGIYALLHVLPGLVGTVISAGLPGAVAYFLAGPRRDDRRLPLTLAAIALGGGAAGAALWLVAAPLLGHVLFPRVGTALVLASGGLVISRLVVTTAKSCSQGANDLAGSNRVIFTEEFMFLPAYGVLWIASVRGFAAVILGMLLADAATASLSWGRLVRRGFFRDADRPSPALARDIAAYGCRAQVGTVMSQLNLRLDFILLNVITGPALLGVYAVASKFAELVRILGMSLSYVLYPKFAREGRAKAGANARRIIPRALLLTVAIVAPLWALAGFAIPAVYGSAFKGAIVPAQIILLGLALEGVGGVITAFLYGVGRPGRNSLAMGGGLAVTVLLDLILIPRYHAVGAATASAAAYLTTAFALIGFFWWEVRSERIKPWSAKRLSRADVGT